MKYYVIADIHGHSNLLSHALEYIKSKNGNDVIFLGDYINRGPDSCGVINLIQNPPEGMKFITLQGNHEEMLYGPYFDYGEVEFYCTKFAAQVNFIAPHDILCWMRELPIYHIVDQNIFVHAYIDPKKDMVSQNKREMLFRRFDINQDFDSDEYHLNHGHTPYKNGPLLHKNRTDLDCSAKDGEQICVGIYERNVKGPVGYAMVYKDGKVFENFIDRT